MPVSGHGASSLPQRQGRSGTDAQLVVPRGGGRDALVEPWRCRHLRLHLRRHRQGRGTGDEPPRLWVPLPVPLHLRRQRGEGRGRGGTEAAARVAGGEEARSAGGGTPGGEVKELKQSGGKELKQYV